MALNLDTTKLRQAGARKTIDHDNCTVLGVGSGSFPRYIDVRPPGPDGARQTAIWDGSFDLQVNDVVMCKQHFANPVWRIIAMGGNDSGVGKMRVYRLWESDYGAVALQSDANGNIEIGKTTGADAQLEVLDAAGAQLRLTFADATSFVDMTVDTNSDLTITPASTGQVIFQPTTDSTDFFQVLDADGGTPVLNVDSTNERVGLGTNAPAGKIDIVGDTLQLRLADTDTDATIKWGRITSRHYTNANQDVSVFLGAVTSSVGTIAIGGGDGPRVAATRLQFYTALTNNVAAGTERMRIDNAGDVGIARLTSLTAQLHVHQNSATGAQAVLSLEQDDVSEEFIRFRGTSTTDATQSLVDAADLTTPGSIVGWLRVYVQDDQSTGPITDGIYFVPFYSAPTA